LRQTVEKKKRKDLVVRKEKQRKNQPNISLKIAGTNTPNNNQKKKNLNRHHVY